MRVPLILLCFFFVCISVVLSCSKDNDILTDLILNQPGSSVNEITENQNNVIGEQSSEVTSPENNLPEGFEFRSTSFPPIHDAHVQSGTVYNQIIVRLEDGQRTSYLMFDLSPIDSIGGSISEVNLQFTIDSDDGSGSITVHKGNSNDWTEYVANGSLPDIGIQLGSITKAYKLGETEEVPLQTDIIKPELFTLIMNHEGGNDLAFASKEHPSQIGSKLLVTYSAPEEAEEIIITADQPSQEGSGSVEGENNKEPIAIADATPTAGGVPLEVTFTGSNSSDDNAVANYSWDFKDGTLSSEPDPIHTFAQVGIYEVNLTVTDVEGLTSTDILTITVSEEGNKAPVAVSTASVTSGDLPLEVIFTGSNSTDDNSVSSYSWNFKDGATATNANPTHTFTEAGSYSVTLTVTDENGLSNTKSLTITVNAPQNEAPVASASASVLSGEAPLEVLFTGSNSTDDKGVISYYWNLPFDDSSAANPTRTFNTPGVYEITLTVKDAAGLSDTATLTITVNAAIGGGTVPEGYYVTTTGNSSNNGQSEASAWSLEYAMQAARAGDIIYVKAGNYGNQELIPQWSGDSGNPIKFVGYRNTPGDILSIQESTFSYGDVIDPNRMPLLKGSSFLSGKALQIHQNYFEIHNFQITDYLIGINSVGKNVVLKNVIITNNGEQNNNLTQGGKSFQISGDNSLVENCFSLNANAEAINVKGGNNCTIRNTKVYSDNLNNLGGYYIAISNGGTNNVIEGCTIYRDPRGDGSADTHQGHGFIMKDQATNNIVRNCKAYNTGIEVNFSGVYNNTFDNIQIFGNFSTYSNQYSSCITINNGAHHNTFKNITIKDTRAAITFIDFDDGFVGSGGDRDENQGGNYNTFINLDVDLANSITLFNSKEIGWSATSKNNEFLNSTFKNVSSIPFITFQTTSGTKFTNCIFQNIPSNVMTEGDPGTLPIYFENCTFTNIGFSIN